MTYAVLGVRGGNWDNDRRFYVRGRWRRFSLALAPAVRTRASGSLSLGGRSGRKGGHEDHRH